MIAISEVRYAQEKKLAELFGKKKPRDIKFLVLSLGTGVSNSYNNKYDAKTTHNWSGIDWLSPVMQISIYDSPVHTTDYYLATNLQTLLEQNKYLRIQVSISTISFG